MYIVNIYGTSYSAKPDMTCKFDIASSMNNGTWTYSTCSVTYDFYNDLIEELDEKEVKEEINKKITEIINSDSGKTWISSPKLRLYYNPADKKLVIQ